MISLFRRRIILYSDLAKSKLASQNSILANKCHPEWEMAIKSKSMKTGYSAESLVMRKVRFVSRSSGFSVNGISMLIAQN